MFIMVVDDNPAVRRSLLRILTAAGHEVFVAGSGHQAMALWDAFGPEVIVSDLDLGRGPNGITVLERAAAEQPRTRRVLMSATPASDPGVVAALQEGTAHAFLAKPFSVGALTAAIRGEAAP